VRTLVIGTTNVGKVRQMVTALAGMELVCVPVTDLVAELPPVAEHGTCASEVAASKARRYHELVDRPVLANDFWLTFDEVGDDEQPRGNVRRIPDHPEGGTDDELLEHYRSLAARHGGRLTARWSLGLAVVGGRGVRSTTVETTRTLLDVASPIRLPGLPLAALQVDPSTGRFVSEHSGDEEDRLWQRAYGHLIASFVPDALRAVADDAS
jgi:hypothetical protein